MVDEEDGVCKLDSRPKAKKSMTCSPCVSMILRHWPCLSWTALPLRARIMPQVPDLSEVREDGALANGTREFVLSIFQDRNNNDQMY